MNQIPVLIVGAGPVGLTLACELARRNVPFRLIDKFVEPPHGSRAKALQPRSLEIFNDLGIAGELMEAGSTDLPYKKFIGAQLLGETPRTIFPRTDTRYPSTLLISQPTVETALRKKLAELGGKTEWNAELTDLKQQNDSVECTLKTAAGDEIVSCRYLVACDGGKSFTRKRLEIGFAGETHETQQLWVGDVEVSGLQPDAWYTWLSKEIGIAFALFPFKNSSTWQLQAVILPDENGKIPQPTLDGFNRLFQERTGRKDVILTKSTWQSIYRVNIRRAEKYRVGNAFIAGDAGHVHSIAGGMGMNTGIQDAYNLGWKLAAVVKGEARDTLLDTYAEERIPIADWLLDTTTRRQQTLMAGAASGKGGFESMASSDNTQLNLNYRGSSLCAPVEATATGLHTGDRAPDVQLTDESWLSEKLRGPEWKLIELGLNPHEAFDKTIRTVVLGDANLGTTYGLNKGMILIRPDGHIAWFGTDAEGLNTYLLRLKGE